MTVYFDKTHRIKKIDGWWVPQWKRGFLRWSRYTLMVADTAMGSIELYSESWRDVMFHTELQATRFMEKAMAQGCKGKFYVGFDDCLPFGIKELVMKLKKIAVYGGAFDPLTVAHEAIIEYLLENYPEVHVYLTENDEKQYNASFQDRYGMLITRFPKLNIHKQSSRTFDMLEAVYGTYATGSENKDPGIDLIIGMDELEALLAGKWKDSEKLIGKYSIRVFNRGRNFNFHTELGDRGDIKPIFVNVPDVSSTAVRRDMFMNPMYEGTAVSPQVLGYIFRHGLYHQDNPVNHWADEHRELANYKPGDYPKPSVTVTSVVINGIGEPTIGREDQVLLVRRKRWPFAGYWCLPGGFTNPHEPIENCSCRELNEETGLVLYPNQVHQLKVYIPEDPRESVPGHWAYDVGVYARGVFGQVKGDDDAAEAAWFPLSVARRTRLAFHHNRILEDYVKAI